MSKVRIITMAVFLLSISFIVPEASAHRPEDGVASGATAIPDPTTSYAYYREFSAGDEVHVYTVEGSAGQEFHAGINIPQIPGLQDYGVSLALIGPGLPELDAARLPDLRAFSSRPSPLPALPQTAAISFSANVSSQGGLIVESVVTEEFYEPFTQTNYWGRQSLDVSFPEDGTYTLVIWQPEEKPGKYVLDTGREEVFGVADLFRFPVWWWETRSYFNQLPSPWVLAFFGFALAGGTFYVLVRFARIIPSSRVFVFRSLAEKRPDR